MYQSRRRPFSTAVPAMNCQTPLALARDSAFGLNALSIERHVRQIERQPFGAEDVLNHRQVLAAALHAFFDEVVQPALEQLDVGEHPLVQRNRDVVAGRSPDRTGHGLCQLAAPWRPERRRQRQQLVDRRRLVLLLGEPVALGQRLDLVGADAIDEPIEVLPDARLGPRAVGRFEQHVDGAIEFLLGGFEVTLLELVSARP